jgi:trk system potassium uptake protein TrkH
VGLRGWLLVQEELGHPWLQGMARLALRVLGVFEGIGAALLFPRWLSELGPKRVAWFAVFHSVLAFANASFDLFGQLGGSSLSADPWINAVVGGLGITVLDELWRWPRSRRLSLHARLVLVVSGALLAGGTLALFAAESEAETPMGRLSPGERLIAAAFHSASARTCGFTTLSLAGLSCAGLLALLVLMFIGVSSASMGGGVKTNTIGAILAVLWAMSRGRLVITATMFFGRLGPLTVVAALARRRPVPTCYPEERILIG